MPNPATGIDTEYEEVWDDVPVELPDQGNKKSATCLSFLTEDAEKETKGCIMKLGYWCQGVLRVGKDISVERWKFIDDEDKSWVLVARVGKNSIGCEIAFGNDESIEAGKTIEVEGRRWVVKEVDWSKTSQS